MFTPSERSIRSSVGSRFFISSPTGIFYSPALTSLCRVTPWAIRHSLQAFPMNACEFFYTSWKYIHCFTVACGDSVSPRLSAWLMRSRLIDWPWLRSNLHKQIIILFYFWNICASWKLRVYKYITLFSLLIPWHLMPISVTNLISGWSEMRRGYLFRELYVLTTWAALPVRNRKMGVENVVQDLETQDRYRLWEICFFKLFLFSFFFHISKHDLGNEQGITKKFMFFWEKESLSMLGRLLMLWFSKMTTKTSSNRPRLSPKFKPGKKWWLVNSWPGACITLIFPGAKW